MRRAFLISTALAVLVGVLAGAYVMTLGLRALAAAERWCGVRHN